MKQSLQAIIEMVGNHRELGETEKSSILETLRALEKKVSVAEFKLERTEKVKKTLSALLDESIKDLEQKKQRLQEQNQELKIEAALERVRTKTMAMHSSDDVGTATATMFTELEKLGTENWRCGIANIHPDQTMEIWSVSNLADGKRVSGAGTFDMNTHPMWQRLYKGWEQKEDFVYYYLTGKEKEDYINILNNTPGYLPQPIQQFPDTSFQAYYFDEDGGIWTFSLQPHSEADKQLMKRFTAVFSLTFRRYQDLKKAEDNAKEAIRQASLDRVRAEIASMRTTEDLQRITPLIWKELTTLKVPLIRCGVFIMDDAIEKVHTYLSTPDGQAIASFHLPYNSTGITPQLVAHWRSRQIFMDQWDETQFRAWGQSLANQGIIQSSGGYITATPPKHLCLHFLPFLQGMLYVGTESPLTTDEIQVVQSLAHAFSTAYARYQDFNQLEASKQQVEKALQALKSTQTKLIQSEKLASLGELTAGIAHEIQNPLNFVNNFSELSVDLAKELSEELDKEIMDKTLVKELAADLTQNQQKINHHGKRAAAIVTGMLQHARASTGVKDPTDLNALADEYLRLAYHGLRAKDPHFNAKIVTDFDPAVGKVDVIPQDMGRVLLNLINNAFYAVQQRKRELSENLKFSESSYEPSVTVSTQKTDNQIIIKVKDNGTGIPEAVKVKIFQPFFTTKPTGQGTGLGLSLAYDIVVKGHGGALEVETKEGEGTTFLITLSLSNK